MKKIVFYLLLGFVVFLPLGCEDNDDNLIPSSLQSKDFVWKGMNLYYLWQEQIDDLADDRFATQNELNTFLKEFTSPSTLFTSLLYERATVDKYSVIYSDYSVLEGVLTGNTKNNGVDFAIRKKPGSETEVYGWVRYIIPGSDAASKDIQRGDLFYAINGTALTIDNYIGLLSTDSYSLNLADYNGGAITPNGQSVSLTKTVLAENPILVNTVLTEGDKKIGYLMYNGFFSAYDTQLNTVFGNFSAQGVTDLVLDLRYNSGGAVTSATKLASMITGQFDGQLFAKEQWNSKAQAYFLANNPSRLENKFVSGLNSLNLTKIYVLTSKSSASASELVINCLKPYIQVVQIGDVTSGKNVGSITLYDSPTFSKTDVNKSHKYAMQPIVLKIVNKNGVGDYTSGITPDYELFEDMAMLGVLGDSDEKLLNKAITLITGSGRMTNQPAEVKQRDLTDTKALQPLRSEMYVEMK
jgi:carboxyl-terminal processing protease